MAVDDLTRYRAGQWYEFIAQSIGPNAMEELTTATEVKGEIGTLPYSSSLPRRALYLAAAYSHTISLLSSLVRVQTRRPTRACSISTATSTAPFSSATTKSHRRLSPSPSAGSVLAPRRPAQQPSQLGGSARTLRTLHSLPFSPLPPNTHVHTH
jgi:hypothetical protein